MTKTEVSPSFCSSSKHNSTCIPWISHIWNLESYFDTFLHSTLYGPRKKITQVSSILPLKISKLFPFSFHCSANLLQAIITSTLKAPVFFTCFLINYFNCRLITVLWWFLPYVDMNQPQVYMCPPSRTSRSTSLPIPSVWVVPMHQLWMPCFMC